MGPPTFFPGVLRKFPPFSPRGVVGGRWTLVRAGGGGGPRAYSVRLGWGGGGGGRVIVKLGVYGALVRMGVGAPDSMACVIADSEAWLSRGRSYCELVELFALHSRGGDGAILPRCSTMVFSHRRIISAGFGMLDMRRSKPAKFSECGGFVAQRAGFTFPADLYVVMLLPFARAARGSMAFRPASFSEIMLGGFMPGWKALRSRLPCRLSIPSKLLYIDVGLTKRVNVLGLLTKAGHETNSRPDFPARSPGGWYR